MATGRQSRMFARSEANQNSNDSDRDSDSTTSEDEELVVAEKMMNMKMGSNSRTKVFTNKTQKTTIAAATSPAKSKKSETAKQAKSESQSAGSTNKHKSSENVVGLDDFKIPGKSKSKQKSNHQEVKGVKWPFDKYDFRLACQLCFHKQEGIHDYVYQPNHSHKCPNNILIVHNKIDTSLSWMKIRLRPSTETHFQVYKLCDSCKRSEKCRIGDVSCTFAHNNAEIEMWNKDRDKEFNISSFIRTAQQEGVVSSEILEARQRRRSSSARKESLSSESEHQPAKTASMQYQPQLKQIKIPSTLIKVTSGAKFDRPPPSTTHFSPSKPYPSQFPPSLVPNLSVPPPVIIGQHNQHGIQSNQVGSRPNSTATNNVSSHHPIPGMFKSSSSAQKQHDRPVVMLENPLPRYHYEICCQQCLTQRPNVWLYDFNSTLPHICGQDTLAFCVKDDNGQNVWLVVRERLSHRDFPGNYILCISVTSNTHSCKHQQNCSFAHNTIEKQLWGLEKSGQFNITEFILQHQGKLSVKGNMSAISVQELINMYGGYFRFICRKCFCSETSSQVISKGDEGKCAGKEKHNWESSCVLAHVHNGTYTVIDERKFVHQGAYYKLCRYLNYCFSRSSDRCRFAHSKVEMSVWRLERDFKLTRKEIVKESSEIYMKNHYKQQQTEPGNAGDGITMGKGVGAYCGVNSARRSFFEEPPVRIGEFCRTCWGNGLKSQQDGQKDKCLKGHSNYKLNSVFIALATAKEIRSLPPSLPAGMKFVLCNSGNKCQKKICTFPHYQEELNTWTFMTKNNIKKLSDVANRCQGIEKAKSRKINTGESVVSVSGTSHTPAWTSQTKPISQIIAPGDLDINEFYCTYCSISCNSQNQWDEHCASPKHRDNVLWDREHVWNFRQPPWGQTDSLILCARHAHNKSCRYSSVPELYNLCKHAHSQDELDEWRERHEFRKMKRQIALQRHMFSYTETLLAEYNESNKTSNVLSESVAGVDVICDQEGLSVSKKEKNATHTWTLTINSKKPLEKVSLLLNQDRLHFNLRTPDGTQHQVSAGNAFLSVGDSSAQHTYRVQVSFTGGLFGSFRQWLSLDFGSRPVLIKKLLVDIGHEFRQEKVQELRKNLDFSRWTGQNKKIVPFSDVVFNKFDDQLLTRYKEPVSIDDIITSDSLKELNRHNYVHKMHKIIELEEITRHRIIASYNVITEVPVSNRIQELGVFIVAQRGELFLKVPFFDMVTEDTDAGKLLMNSVKSALIALPQAKSNTVYEAQVVQEINYGYNGIGTDYVYLCISQSSANALDLSSGKTFSLEIQFQMDRLFFCRMHFALDSVQDMDLLFPDVLKFKSCLGRDVNVSSSVLNDDQIKAVQHIIIDRDIYSPPFIMYGPFGTGKTETIAQATMSLLLDKKPCRVLICTKSNSAADLYITKHFDEFLKKLGKNYKILRILDQLRKVTTVSETVFPYCYVKENGEFGIPSKEVIMQHQVVLVTVESSIQLSSLDLHGSFSHIFVDEAGQILECEVLMPLCLATTKTCVVLTGDHLQMSPPVYSLMAQQQNFDVSILVRLFNYYDGMARGAIANTVVDKSHKSPLKIQLNINYRTKSEILRFISTVFYGGPDTLKAYAKVPSVLNITPLAFYSVQGKESHSGQSCSYMNPSEAAEIVSQVGQLLDEWPKEWGPKNPQAIAVITNYRDQVRYIRQTLNRSKKKELCRVYVDTIQGVQGKEFRAVFISTVRTTNLLHEPHILDALNEGRDIGDLGFLSNPKLLNTALTRTQSFVGVVGDPIALCLIGDCIQEWRTYIKHCSNLRSIHPATHTYDFVRNQVVQLQVSPEGQIVDMLSKQKDKKLQQSFPPIQKKSSTTEEIFVEDEEDSEEEEELPDVPPFIPSIHQETSEKEIMNNNNHLMNSFEMFFQRPLPNISASSSTASSELSIPEKLKQQSHNLDNYYFNKEVSTEDVIFQLAKEIIPETSQGTSNVLIKSECIQVTEKNGFACLSYDADKKPDSEPFRVTMDNEDLVIFSVKDRDTGSMVEYESWSKERLESYIGKSGFFRCRMSVVGEKRVATVLPPNSNEMRHGIEWTGKEVEFLHQFDCGHALNGDEVLVKLSDKSKPGRLIGEVKGILRSPHDKTNRLLVCEVSSAEPGILKPIDKNFPFIYSLLTTTRLSVAEKGIVPLYSFAPSTGIEFDRYENTKTSHEEPQLFVVRYLTWVPKLSLPVGLVVGILETGTSLDVGMKILNIEHSLCKPIQPQVEQVADEVFAESLALLSGMNLAPGRVNLTGSFCFTIIDEDTQDVEMAIHMEQFEEFFKIGIHVADVSTFVKKDSIIDHECELRSPSLFPHGREARHMLPMKVCTDMCSLKTDYDRLAVSVLMMVDDVAGQVGDIEVQRSVVNVKQSFTLAEVEDILLNSDLEGHDDFFQSCLVTLYMLSTHWRTRRLGNSSFASNLLPGQLDKQHAQLMMDELKHQFNTAVAALLEKAFPQCTPLLVQPAPSSKEIDNWRRECAKHAFNSIPMSRPFLEKQVCRCNQMCTCVFSFMRAHQLQPTQHVMITRDSWQALYHVGSPNEFDAEKAKDLISDVKNMPQISLCDIKFAAIQQPENFACNGVVSESGKEHYGMNVLSYTPFTNPLRHFIGIVVQRLLLAHLDGSESPYTTQEVVELCAEANSHQSQMSRFESESLSLHLGVALQKCPLSVLAVVEKIDSEKIVLSLCGVDGVSEEDRTLTLLDLTPASVKTVDQGEGLVNVQWEERIYNYAGSRFPSQLSRDAVMELDPNHLVYRIPTQRWQQLLTVTRKMVSLDAGETEFSAFSTHLQDMANAMGDQLATSNAVQHEPICQEGRDGAISQRATFSMTFQPGQCLSVQMGASLSQGLMAPSLKLIGLTPQLDFCLDHMTNPQACFCPSQPTAMTHSNSTFSSIRAYQNHWMPMLIFGSAHEAVKEGERITIHGVSIRWSSRQENGPDQLVTFGELVLSRNFLERSKIQLPEDDGSKDQCLALMCVRYKHMEPPNLSPSPDPNVTALLTAENKVTWVGHCIVTRIKCGKNDIKVTIRLVQSSFSIPQALLTMGGDKISCTLEWIAKGRQYSILDDTVRNASTSSQFTQDIILGRKPDNSIEPIEMPKGMYLEHMSFSQQMALGDSYRNPFTFVLGGPGTGKSILASCLAALLVFRNTKVDCLRQQSATPAGLIPKTQLMVCAPTEFSLDVLTDFIKTLNQNMTLVRVYSQDVEDSDFPTVLKPGEARFKPSAQKCNVMKDIALHHLIRIPGKCVENDNLLQQEMLMSMYGDSPTQVSAVKNATAQAQKYQLMKAHVILCTCLTSARKIVRDFTNIKQLIIDDANHCSELECLTPAVWHPKLQQMVVLGDRHMPHPPPSTHDINSCLERSLIHRLADMTQTTLTQQFRFNDSLCEFPSSYFYFNLLTSTTSQTPAPPPIPSFQWPSVTGFHSLFYHLEGGQEAVVVSPGGDGSCGFVNKEEAAMIRNLVWSMVVKQQVNPSTIKILTFSPAQTGLIQSAVMHVGLNHVKVCTVQESIGRECNFVLVSTVRSIPASGISHPPLTSWIQRHLGPVSEPYLVNMALTRAQKALFIFGNKDLLSVCEPWKSLLDFYRGKQAIVTGLSS